MKMHLNDLLKRTSVLYVSSKANDARDQGISNYDIDQYMCIVGGFEKCTPFWLLRIL